MREAKDHLRARAARIGKALARLYPDARISLEFETPWQCLAATILSAQCTDERVNKVTPALFKEFPDPHATATAPPHRIEQLIASTGFFRQKTKSLMGAAKAIAERHGGKVPDTMEDLVRLPGVGRKTANVILGHVYGKPGFVVDTHVRRLVKRLGFTASSDPDQIETDMGEIVPPREWTAFSMRLILHGRSLCSARAPRCDICPLSEDCPKIGVPSLRPPKSRAQRRRI